MQLKQIYRLVASISYSSSLELARCANPATLSSVFMDLGIYRSMRVLSTAINAALLAGELVEKLH